MNETLGCLTAGAGAFFPNDPFDGFRRYRSPTNGPIARRGMTASFLVNLGDVSLPPDTWDLPIFNAFYKESGESWGRASAVFVEYLGVDVVWPH